MDLIKAAFFDFDGTLVPSDDIRLPDSAVVALKALRANGVSIWLCTGRAIYQVPQIVTSGLGGAGAPDGYVCSSGSWCVDADGVFFKCLMDPADVAAMVRAVEEGVFDFLVMTPESPFVNRISPRIRRQMEDADLVYPVDDPRRALESEVLQMCAFVDPDEDHLVLDRTEHVACYRWSPDFCDVVPADSGKGRGVEATLEHLGISRDEAIGFGDGGNDVPMLEACGTSVAMGNGTPEAKAAATFVTDDVKEDGLYRACVALGLIDDSLGLARGVRSGAAGE